MIYINTVNKRENNRPVHNADRSTVNFNGETHAYCEKKRHQFFRHIKLSLAVP